MNSFRFVVLAVCLVACCANPEIEKLTELMPPYMESFFKACSDVFQNIGPTSSCLPLKLKDEAFGNSLKWDCADNIIESTKTVFERVSDMTPVEKEAYHKCVMEVQDRIMKEVGPPPQEAVEAAQTLFKNFEEPLKKMYKEAENIISQ